MNGLKARLISIRNRICRHLCKRRTNSRQKRRAFGRRVSSSLKRFFTIHRLRLKISKCCCFYSITACVLTLVLLSGRRRTQSSRCDRKSKTASPSPPPCEGERVHNARYVTVITISFFISTTKSYFLIFYTDHLTLFQPN